MKSITYVTPAGKASPIMCWGGELHPEIWKEEQPPGDPFSGHYKITSKAVSETHGRCWPSVDDPCVLGCKNS